MTGRSAVSGRRTPASAKLPHMVGSAEIASPELKKVVMQFMENFLALASRLDAAEREIASLKKGG